MKVKIETIPRTFKVNGVTIRDFGEIILEPDEMITFLTNSGGEFDFTRKEWGFYVTPSLNGRLLNFGFRTVLVRNVQTERYYVLVVESGKEASMYQYLDRESSEVVHWLDSTESLEALRAKISRGAFVQGQAE